MNRIPSTGTVIVSTSTPFFNRRVIAREISSFDVKSVSMNPDNAPASFGTLAIIPGRIASSFIADITSCCRRRAQNPLLHLHGNGHNQAIPCHSISFYPASSVTPIFSDISFFTSISTPSRKGYIDNRFEIGEIDDGIMMDWNTKHACDCILRCCNLPSDNRRYSTYTICMPGISA